MHELLVAALLFIVVFWRLALRLLLAIIVLAVGAGLALVAQNVHH